MNTERIKDTTFERLVEKIEGRLDSFKPEQMAVVFYAINFKKHNIGNAFWQKIEEALTHQVIKSHMVLI